MCNYTYYSYSYMSRSIYNPKEQRYSYMCNYSYYSYKYVFVYIQIYEYLNLCIHTFI